MGLARNDSIAKTRKKRKTTSDRGKQTERKEGRDKGAGLIATEVGAPHKHFTRYNAAHSGQ